MASGRENPADYEALKRMMDGFSRFVEQQAEMIHDLLGAVKDLSERVARCEVSQEETFRTRLDQLASESTPEGRSRAEETGYATNLPSDTANATRGERLIDFDADPSDSAYSLGAQRQAPDISAIPQVAAALGRLPEPRADVLRPTTSRPMPQPLPRATTRPPVIGAMPNRTPINPA